MIGVVGSQLMKRAGIMLKRKRGSRCLGSCESFWTLSYKILKPKVISQFGLVPKHPQRQGLGTKFYLGSNLRSLVRVEDKVTRKANKRVTNECCRQLGLNHEACLWTFPLRGREAGHIPTNSQPSLFKRCLCSVNSHHVCKTRISSSYDDKSPKVEWTTHPKFLARNLLIIALKVLHPENSQSPGQAEMTHHSNIETTCRWPLEEVKGIWVGHWQNLQNGIRRFHI